MKLHLHLSGPRRAGAVALAASSALIATATVSAAPAQSALDPSCPTPVSARDLPDSAPVHGLTVTKGTVPGSFTGTFQGVLEDGIAPGVDLILMDLHSTTIDKVGIWSGMSGSPVYDASGGLIGAVSYNLGLGPSTIAGVTPATEMAKLLRGSASATTRARSTIRLPRALARTIVGSGAATSAQVGEGVTQLRMPISLSGVSATRLRQLAPVLNLGRGHTVSASPGATSGERIPVVVGGNMAASMSYGTVTAAGLGTATIVCGDEVVGFGHPFNFSGPATMSLHGARTVLIQDDQTLGGFAVANLGAPVGNVDNDRLAGIHAVTGAPPASTGITSLATESTRSFTGSTHVTQPELVPELGFVNMLVSQEKVLDRVGKGAAAAAWTIEGRRANGAFFRLKRDDLYADPFDVSGASAAALAGDLEAIQGNEGEIVKITSVRTESKLSDSYAAFAISKVQARVFGSWTTLNQDEPVALRAGTVATLKVFLTSRETAPRTVYVKVFVPVHAVNRLGTLDVLGGNEFAEESGDFFDGELLDFGPSPAPSSSTFPALLKSLTSGPKHNQVRATLHFPHARGTASKARIGTTTLKRVVSGELSVPVFAVR